MQSELPKSYPLAAEVNRADQTARGFDESADYLGLSIEELIGFLWGKQTLDVGSGYGGLAIASALANIPGSVFSVNPGAFTRPNFKPLQERVIHEHFKGFGPERIAAALAHHKARLVAAVGQKLPFTAGTFDNIFDINAVSYYSYLSCPGGKFEQLQYETYVRELYRVLKPDGRFFIADLFHLRPSSDNWRYRMLLRFFKVEQTISVENQPEKVNVLHMRRRSHNDARLHHALSLTRSYFM